MQKRSHKLLAASLLESRNGFQRKRFELAFLFGSFQPDCNPLSYIKGSIRSHKLRGHNYSNADLYIARQIVRLQRREKSWTCWQYYTLGKLTHYLADAFTYPHNEHYPDSLLEHHRYEDALREYLCAYLNEESLGSAFSAGCELNGCLRELHRQYMDAQSDMRRDVRYILEATSMLMSSVLPQSVLAAIPAAV
ncbi:hypothetical protein SDC9_83383 [bioreactor metagenome]|uniref:Phospholipase C/D domain-containing protein n=1 Tax=bioreactor metagenome TaxID=1076179 RepID=A0A644Z9Y4_9ZZZZ